MKATHYDFQRENPRRANIGGGATAQAVFDLLSLDSSIIAMIDASEQGKPALTPCVQQIENFLEKRADPDFDVSQDKVRQTIGGMVKTILRPFGYRKISQRSHLPKGTGRYFVTAARYTLSAPEEATMRVVRTIEEI